MKRPATRVSAGQMSHPGTGSPAAARSLRWCAFGLILIGVLGGLSGSGAAESTLLYERFEGNTSGTIQGGVRFVPEVVAYGGLGVDNRFSARFDGQPQTAIRFGPEIKITSPEFTVEAFVKPEESWNYVVIAAHWGETGDQRAWALVLFPGNGLRFDVMPDGKFYPGNSLSTSSRLLRGGAWYHVAAVSQGQTSRLYVNGHLCAETQRSRPGIFVPKPAAASDEPTASRVAAGAALQVGNAPQFSGQPRPFAGWLDEVRITSRALAPHEFLKSRDPMPVPRGPIPDKYELPFVATTSEQALAWQQRARQRLFELVAARTPRQDLKQRPLNFQITAAEDRGEYTLHQASFQGNDGQRYPCLWTVPKGTPPFPAVLALHGHGGSAEEVFDPRSPYRGFGHHLAQGGYCVLAPSFPHRPFAAETLWDLLRCVDTLAAQNTVDSKRLGVMGLSMGGEWTMWVAACDERLKTAVVSGWMCTTEGVFAVFNCPCWELPGFVDLMDVCEVNLLIAPRPVLFESAESDPCFLLRYTRQGFDRIRAGYRVFGAPAAATHDVFPGGHMVHGDRAYPMLDHVLGGKAASMPKALRAK